MKQLTDTLFVEKVPVDATDFAITDGNDLKYYHGETYTDKTGYPFPKRIPLPPGNWSIVGMVDAERSSAQVPCPICCGDGVVIDMDTIAECCRCPLEDGSCCGIPIAAPAPFQTQCSACHATGFMLHEDLVRLIESKTGWTFSNPMGDEPVYSEYVPAYLNDNFNKANKIEEYEKDCAAWSEWESKVVEKIIVLSKN